MLSFDYSGKITTDAASHVKLMNLFKRQPTVEEFKELFKVSPVLLIQIKPWPTELDMTGCLDAFPLMTHQDQVNIISTMMNAKMTASDIMKYIVPLMNTPGLKMWKKRVRSYFNVKDDVDELIEAIRVFHADGLMANGLRLQHEYDDYVHRHFSASKPAE